MLPSSFTVTNPEPSLCSTYGPGSSGSPATAATVVLVVVIVVAGPVAVVVGRATAVVDEALLAAAGGAGRPGRAVVPVAEPDDVPVRSGAVVVDGPPGRSGATVVVAVGSRSMTLPSTWVAGWLDEQAAAT